MNVVSLGKFKELKEEKRKEESYGRYLKTLCNSQLETEVNSLIEEFSDSSSQSNFALKGQIIMKEITGRADYPVQMKIKNLSKTEL